MLIGAALGTLPSNFTFPLTLAVPWLLACAIGLPAFKDRRPAMQMIAVKPNTRMKLFIFITPYLLFLAHVICFSPYRRSRELLLAPDEIKAKRGHRRDCHKTVKAVSFWRHYFVKRYLLKLCD
jgi:hypothetical protein